MPTRLPHTTDRPRVPCSVTISDTTYSLCIPIFPTSPQSAAQEDLGGLTPSPAESYELLWLAEVEHILGAASLQLAFAAASKFNALNSEPPTEVSPIRVARSMDATRAHRPWGYGSGPLAGVSATGADIFEREWGGEAGAKDGVSNIAASDENFIIEQLEV